MAVTVFGGRKLVQWILSGSVIPTVSAFIKGSQTLSGEAKMLQIRTRGLAAGKLEPTEWFKRNRSGQIFQDQLVLDVCQPKFCKKQVALAAEAVSANL